MWDPVDGPERWVVEKGGRHWDEEVIGLGRAGLVEPFVGPVFFDLGGWTFLRAICLPNTTRASPIWRSVPWIEMWRSSLGPSAKVDVVEFKALTTLTDNVPGGRVRNDHCDEVVIGLALDRERLSKGEGDGGVRDSTLSGAWGASARPLPLVEDAPQNGGTLDASCESANPRKGVLVEAIVGPAEASMQSNLTSRESSLSASRQRTEERSSVGVGVRGIMSDRGGMSMEVDAGKYRDEHGC
ncbi:hypothetical protein BYT27DRAFT_7209243 [Phlegmacium glaucopus]|nr:hypothetical protein BYT27DRAFT_7209243 [Phlegmacium glaucopus]